MVEETNPFKLLAQHERENQLAKQQGKNEKFNGTTGKIDLTKDNHLNDRRYVDPALERPPLPKHRPRRKITNTISPGEDDIENNMITINTEENVPVNNEPENPPNRQVDDTYSDLVDSYANDSDSNFGDSSRSSPVSRFNSTTNGLRPELNSNILEVSKSISTIVDPIENLTLNSTLNNDSNYSHGNDEQLDTLNSNKLETFDQSEPAANQGLSLHSSLINVDTNTTPISSPLSAHSPSSITTEFCSSHDSSALFTESQQSNLSSQTVSKKPPLPLRVSVDLPVSPSRVSADSSVPPTPLRPPTLPKRRTSSLTLNRISSLDPGSSSTVSDYYFYKNGRSNSITSNNHGSPVLSQQPSLDEPSSHFQSPLRSPIIAQRKNSCVHRYDVDPTPASQSVHFEDVSSPNKPIPHSCTIENTVVPILNSSNDSNHTLPIITVTTLGNGPPPLPKKPQLPKKPENLSSLGVESPSAYQLLENYSRRSSQTGIVKPKTFPQADDIDMKSLENLGITSEMIEQQREIEERIQRENLMAKQIRTQASEQGNSQDSSSLLSVVTEQSNIGRLNSSALCENDDRDSVNSFETSSIATATNDIPDDVSQLEIPTNTSRTASFSSANDTSDLQSTNSVCGASINIFENGDLTEEEFIKLLPPVPAYSKIPNETEISIPNGKAINILEINENHPKEDPPVYSPVSDALKKLINRPQFSQTGGDARSTRIQEQQQEQSRGHRRNSRSHPNGFTPNHRSNGSAGSASIRRR